MTAGAQGDLAPAAPLLEAVGVSKSYGPRRAFGARPAVLALDNVSLDVHAGDRLAIVGESGSGKSTLARLFLALEEPTAGEIRFEGTAVDVRRGAALANLRRAVQIVFQDPLGSLDPRMSIGESVAEPLRALHIPGDHRARVDDLLNAVGLSSAAARRYPHQFSGGQRQRVAIARALAPRPRVLVADEAVSALDVSVRAQVLNLIDDLVDRFGLTLVFISHDLAVVRHLCTRVAVLYRGRLVEQGPAEQVYQEPRHPYTRALLQAVPRLGHVPSPSAAPTEMYAPARSTGS
jgi:peptide/nickel transport system ATP-binding protein